MRISDWSSDVCSSDLSALPNACHAPDCLGNGPLRQRTAGHLGQDQVDLAHMRAAVDLRREEAHGDRGIQHALGVVGGNGLDHAAEREPGCRVEHADRAKVMQAQATVVKEEQVPRMRIGMEYAGAEDRKSTSLNSSH